MNYEHLTDPEKIELIYKIFGSVNDIVTRLWRIAWGLGHRANMSILEYEKTSQIIKEYGYDKVRDAFGRAKEQDILKLSYVEGILRKQLAQENATKAEEENRIRKLKASRKIEVLPDLEKVREAFKFPEPIKEKKSIDYERAKQEFEGELDKR